MLLIIGSFCGNFFNAIIVRVDVLQITDTTSIYKTRYQRKSRKRYHFKSFQHPPFFQFCSLFPKILQFPHSFLPIVSQSKFFADLNKKPQIASSYTELVTIPAKLPLKVNRLALKGLGAHLS